MKKKILIIGSSAKEYALAKKLSETNEVFVAPGNVAMKEFVTLVDIRENAVNELLEYVMENGIDLTIPTSLNAINTNIVELFTKNNQLIFAPSQGAARLAFDKCIAKKILYKLRIPTPKFGIFEKQNMTMDYIKNLKNPFVIKTNDSSSAVVLTSPQVGKSIIETLFVEQNQKVLVEDYVWGTPFSFYTITDGYKALSLGSSIVYKHSLEGDGGQLTCGMGACFPNFKLSIEQENYIMEGVVYPTLEYLEAENNPYIGILGVNGIISENGQITVLGYQTFFQDVDSDAFLANIDTDLYSLFESCVIGSFSDEVDYIPQKDLSATSVSLCCKNKENKENVIAGLEKIDEDMKVSFFSTVTKNRYLEYEAHNGAVVVLTALASTLAKSTKNVYEEINNIDFAGKIYRKDICKPIKTDF